MTFSFRSKLLLIYLKSLRFCNTKLDDTRTRSTWERLTTDVNSTWSCLSIYELILLQVWLYINSLFLEATDHVRLIAGVCPYAGSFYLNMSDHVRIHSICKCWWPSTNLLHFNMSDYVRVPFTWECLTTCGLVLLARIWSHTAYSTIH